MKKLISLLVIFSFCLVTSLAIAGGGQNCGGNTDNGAIGDDGQGDVTQNWGPR